MSLNCIHRKLQSFLLSLLILCFAHAFCEKESSTIYDIRFGVIEPPVVAQKDITVWAPTSNQQVDNKPLECSGTPPSSCCS